MPQIHPSSMINRLSKAILRINKKFGENSIGKISEMPTIKAECIPSGSPYLDNCIGGGWPLGKTIELYGPYSCIDRNTFIPYVIVDVNGKVQNKKGGTIENLYKRFHKINRNGKGYYQRKQTINSSFLIPSVNTDGFVLRNPIVNVIKTGKKQCFELKTEKGMSIISTSEHRFLTNENRYKKLEYLKVGNVVFVNSGERPTKKHKVIKYKEILVKYHPNWRIKKVGKYLYNRGKYAEFIYEANLNKVTPDEYRKILNTKNKEIINKMKFIPKGYIVHHKDHNPQNDNLTNLLLVTKKEHSHYHGAKNHINGIFGVKINNDKIISIKKVGIRETYDISCQSPYNNYIANKIVTHNSGKSLIALRTIAEAQKLGKKCVYLDAENAFDPKFAKKLGVDIDKLVVSQISSGEKVFDIIDILLESDVSIIVVDSVASLVPKYEIEESIEKQTMALQARLMSKALRKLTGKAAKNKTLIFFVNQIREKIGSYGNPEITSGGRALGFYASLRVEVRRGEFLTKSKKKIGQQVKFKVTKSKVCQPYRDGYFLFYYPNAQNPDLGLFDTADELVSMLLIQGKIKRRGSYYDILGKSFRGREELEQEIRTNPKFETKLTKL